MTSALAAIVDAAFGPIAHTLLLLTARLLPLVTLLPVFGGIKASPTVRSGALLALVVGLWPATLVAPVDGGAVAMLGVAASQALFGFATAAVVFFVFEAARMIGGIADTALGRGSFGAADPLGGVGGPLSTLHALLFLAVFAATGSHVLLLRGFALGIETFPLTATLGEPQIAALADEAIRFSAGALAAGVAFALPAVGVGLLVDLSLGWINRTLPRLPVLFMAMPLRMLLGWTVLAGGAAAATGALVATALDAADAPLRAVSADDDPRSGSGAPNEPNP